MSFAALQRGWVMTSQAGCCQTVAPRFVLAAGGIADLPTEAVMLLGLQRRGAYDLDGISDFEPYVEAGKVHAVDAVWVMVKRRAWIAGENLA